MIQLEIYPIPNPCQRLCESDKKGYCKTCLRSRQERFDWLNYSDAEKRQVLEKLARRKAYKARVLHQKALEQQNGAPLEPTAEQATLFGDNGEILHTARQRSLFHADNQWHQPPHQTAPKAPAKMEIEADGQIRLPF